MFDIGSKYVPDNQNWPQISERMSSYAIHSISGNICFTDMLIAFYRTTKKTVKNLFLSQDDLTCSRCLQNQWPMVFFYSKLTIETLEQGVKYVQS